MCKGTGSNDCQAYPSQKGARYCSVYTANPYFILPLLTSKLLRKKTVEIVTRGRYDRKGKVSAASRLRAAR